MPSERTHQKLIAERAGQERKQRDIQRLNAIDVKSVEILGIIGIGHTAAQSRPQPLVLLAKGKNMIEILRGDIGLEKAPIGSGRNRSHWDCGLVVTVGGAVNR